MTKLTEERYRRLRSLVDQGLNREEIARQLHVSLPTLWRWARRLGVALPDGRRRVEIPGWVPRELVNVYRQVAREKGEEVAAMRVRRIKHAS